MVLGVPGQKGFSSAIEVFSGRDFPDFPEVDGVSCCVGGGTGGVYQALLFEGLQEAGDSGGAPT